MGANQPMESAHLRVVAANSTDIPFQTASVDIWDKKYRLKTKDGEILDDTIDLGTIISGTYDIFRGCFFCFNGHKNGHNSLRVFV